MSAEEKSMARDLPVCPRCGWAQLMGHSDGPNCWPKAGKAADSFMKALHEVGIRSTKAGYGDHCVAALLAGARTVVFEAADNTEDTDFRVAHVFISYYSADGAVALSAAVNAVKATR